MKAGKFRIIKNRKLTTDGRLHLLQLAAPGIEAAPGQFVNILTPGHYLRRPISVADYRGEVLTLLIDEVGDGTRRICSATEGDELDMLTGLGNRFSLTPPGPHTALIGGGVGFAPLVGLAITLKEKGLEPVCFWGFNDAGSVPEAITGHLQEEFGIEVKTATMNGSKGYAGNPVEMAKEYYREKPFEPDFFYTCGPLGMMRAAADAFDCPGELSLDSRMGCGFGACMCCSIETADGPKRICREGPVFQKSEIKTSTKQNC